MTCATKWISSDSFIAINFNHLKVKISIIPKNITPRARKREAKNEDKWNEMKQLVASTNLAYFHPQVYWNPVLYNKIEWELGANKILYSWKLINSRLYFTWHLQKPGDREKIKQTKASNWLNDFESQQLYERYAQAHIKAPPNQEHDGVGANRTYLDVLASEVYVLVDSFTRRNLGTISPSLFCSKRFYCKQKQTTIRRTKELMKSSCSRKEFALR